MTRAAPIVLAAVAACSGTIPATHYYQLATPATPAPRATGTSVLAIEPLSSDSAYDDERIVYRVDPVRLDYYQYHRWSSAPGSMVSGYLQQALARSGLFRSVV
ncbi:MAG TPA: ABC-type transport auxiliary lipoprotein family protein, partial [Kofleriaceae bacterium]